MNDIHDSKVNNAASNGASHGPSGIIAARRLVTDSARRATDTIRSHPYFASGVLAGIGLATVGAVLMSRRRRTLLDRLMDMF
jgi:ElaB/YqjD/DUF883 family membrane-anchored ribosome-binding protein